MNQRGSTRWSGRSRYEEGQAANAKSTLAPSSRAFPLVTALSDRSRVLAADEALRGGAARSPLDSDA